eukprot:107252-Pleurochrysis_carterae.AAC.1
MEDHGPHACFSCCLTGRAYLSSWTISYKCIGADVRIAKPEALFGFVSYVLTARLSSPCVRVASMPRMQSPPSDGAVDASADEAELIRALLLLRLARRARVGGGGGGARGQVVSHMSAALRTLRLLVRHESVRLRLVALGALPELCALLSSAHESLSMPAAALLLFAVSSATPAAEATLDGLATPAFFRAAAAALAAARTAALVAAPDDTRASVAGRAA